MSETKQETDRCSHCQQYPSRADSLFCSFECEVESHNLAKPPSGPMSERNVTHLGGLPVYTNKWLPVGGFWCHPDTLNLGAADVERIVEGLKFLERARLTGGRSA